MSVDEIRRHITNGFRPFVIRASDGREYRVPHKEFIMVTRRTVVVADEQGFVDILDPLHIAAVHQIGDLPKK